MLREVAGLDFQVVSPSYFDVHLIFLVLDICENECAAEYDSLPVVSPRKLLGGNLIVSDMSTGASLSRYCWSALVLPLELLP